MTNPVPRPHLINDYAQAKGPLIAEIVRNAETWSAEVGWDRSVHDGPGALDDGCQ